MQKEDIFGCLSYAFVLGDTHLEYHQFQNLAYQLFY